jgi:crotonobetainyl-CoA:carnitine CoA-transferase CaiB-like acyl-CoA transferase
MDIADVLDDPQGRDPVYRAQYSRELYERVKPWLSERSKQRVFEEAQAWRLPAAPVQTIAERLRCPQLEARGFWRTADVDGREVRVPRVPYMVGRVEPADAAAPVTDRARGAPITAHQEDLPYAGLRVLDLTGFWSGPYATQLLGALGADVIKVESVQRPDPYRYQMASMRRERWYECSPVFNDANCNKRDLTLDLTSTAGRQLFERLVKESDVVISNFANRVMPNLALTKDRLLELNPRVIVVTMPGYGSGGPWEDYVGYAIAFEQLICASMTGYPGGTPSYAGGFCDPLVGMHAVAAIDLALQERERSGHGLAVEVPQCEILETLFAPEQIAVQLGAPLPTMRGNKHDWMAPHDAYQVASEDEWLTIAVATDEEFTALAGALGQAELAQDGRFATVQARKEHEPELDHVIAQLVRGRDGRDLERDLQSLGVRACRVLKAYHMPEDESLAAFRFVQEMERDVTGTLPYKTWPFRFDDIDTSHKHPPPLLGEHNAEVLRDVLGLTQEEIDRLTAEAVIGWQPIGYTPPES